MYFFFALSFSCYLECFETNFWNSFEFYSCFIGFFLSGICQNLSIQVSNLLKADLIASFSTNWFVRNWYYFKGVKVPIAMDISFVFQSIHEVNLLQSGRMYNSLLDLQILKNLGVKNRVSKAPKIIEVCLFIILVRLKLI